MIETSTTGILETGRDANWLEIISGPREIKLAANTYWPWDGIQVQVQVQVQVQADS